MIIVKRNDLKPDINATLLDQTGVPIDLTGATVRFIIASSERGVIVNAPATIVNATQGKVRYTWVSGDTANAGEYRAEFEVTFSDGRKLTVPNDSYISVRILEDLA
jgi:hypothetical protein